MRPLTESDRARLKETLVGNAMLLLFGCSVLAFLVAIGHRDWFTIRPATGTALALARSSQASEEPRVGTAPAQPVEPEAAAPK